MSSKKAFMMVAAVGLMLPLSALAKNYPYVDAASPEQDPAAITIQLIKKGDFLQPLDDGMYVINVPAEKLGRDKDVQCIVVKDTALQGHTGLAGLSCDFN